jgi:hypothetical protein
MSNQLTSKQYLLQLHLIYGAQAFFMLLFGVIAFVVSQSTEHTEDSFARLLVYILVAAVIASLTGAHFVFNFIIQRIDKTLPLKPKLQKYSSAVLIRSALLEFPGLLASVVCILTGSLLPLMAVLLILVVFVLLRPSTSQISQDLTLSHEERGILVDPKSVLE